MLCENCVEGCLEDGDSFYGDNDCPCTHHTKGWCGCGDGTELKDKDGDWRCWICQSLDEEREAGRLPIINLEAYPGFEVAAVHEYEYCVMIPEDPNEPHRGPMSEREARMWVGDDNKFYVARRIVGVWERAPLPCDGLLTCASYTHYHGCFADHGNCDSPEEHNGG